MTGRIPLRSIATGACLAANAAGAFAQAAKSQTDSTQTKLAQPDYAVPEAPALTLVKGDGSNLLRPSSPHALTAALSSTQKGGIGIPNGFGVEFAPFMLARASNLPLSEYQKHAWLYRFRTSLATSRDTSTSARPQIALGFRFSPFDASDLREDSAFITNLQALTNLQASREALITDSLTKVHLSPFDSSNDTDAQKAMRKSIAAYFATFEAAREKELVKAYTRRVADTTWNGSKLDFAYGALWSSADSLGRGTTISGHSLWATYSFQMKNAELLLGARGAYARDSLTAPLRWSGGGGVRAYIGSNQMKMLIDLENTGAAAGAAKWLFNAGGELQLSQTLWAHGTVGWQAKGSAGGGRLVTDVKFSMAPQLP